MGVTAIMTETDRKRIKRESDEPAEKRYQATSRIRKRITALEQDANILKEHHPDLYRELQKAICDE
ncbi:hypothetical protein ELS19_17545 [Halogeometricum borinquense]|nr:hypothetical protein ELS19_17545 [Halogeometricum borinquense]